MAKTGKYKPGDLPPGENNEGQMAASDGSGNSAVSDGAVAGADSPGSVGSVVEPEPATATAVLEPPVEPPVTPDDGFKPVINPDGSQPASATPPVTAEPIVQGVPKLKPGHHKEVAAGVYDVYGCELWLEGKVFIAGKDINWVHINKCSVCGRERKRATELVFSENGNGMTALIAYCDNTRTCKVHGKYVFVHSAGTIITG